MSATQTQLDLDDPKGSRCEPRTIREVLHTGRKLDLCTALDEAGGPAGWARITHLGPDPEPGYKIIHCADGYGYRVRVNDAILCRRAYPEEES